MSSSDSSDPPRPRARRPNRHCLEARAGDLPSAPGANVSAGTKFNIAAWECREFGNIARAAMDEPYAARLHTTVPQFPTQTDHHSQPALDLMPIQVSAKTNMIKYDSAGVPLLHRIPFLGAALGSKSTNKAAPSWWSSSRRA